MTQSNKNTKSQLLSEDAAIFITPQQHQRFRWNLLMILFPFLNCLPMIKGTCWQMVWVASVSTLILNSNVSAMYCLCSMLNAHNMHQFRSYTSLETHTFSSCVSLLVSFNLTGQALQGHCTARRIKVQII